MLGLLLRPLLFPGADARHGQHWREAQGAHAARRHAEAAGDRRRARAEPGAVPRGPEHRGPARARRSRRARCAAQTHDVVLRIAPDFGERLAREPQRRGRADLRQLAPGFADPGGARARRGRAVQRHARGPAQHRPRASARRSLQPVRVAQRDVATPEAKRGMLLAFLPYLLILSSFLGGAYLVIDVTAGERERQSLEPLLATPAARAAIMSGKILAAVQLRHAEPGADPRRVQAELRGRARADAPGRTVVAAARCSCCSCCCRWC